MVCSPAWKTHSGSSPGLTKFTTVERNAQKNKQPAEVHIVLLTSLLLLLLLFVCLLVVVVVVLINWTALSPRFHFDFLIYQTHFPLTFNFPA